MRSSEWPQISDQGHASFVASGPDGCFKSYDATQRASAFINPRVLTTAHITEDNLK